MPSTYSTLKIQLMGTGENSTTWGDVTNVNLGTAIEEAIVGSADVTFASADVTLTLTNTNAAQTARNVRLRCTGTTGGVARNLIVPSIEKPYIVQNSCADGIVVKTAAGSGVTIPTGRTMWVYSDATNVVDVTTHLSSLTLTTALAVAQGGTGSSTAGGARTNLGATTVGGNLFTLANPSAITFPRINADNSVSTLAAGAFRTAIGSTTVGDNLFVLANPSAITFPRFNADNTVSALDAATFRGAIGAGVGNGSVTSVGGTGTVNGITLTGSVSTSGNLTLGGTLSGVSLTTQVSGTLPIANGGTGSTATAYCSLTTNVTGTLPIVNGGTGATTAGAALTALGAYPAANPSGYTSNVGTVTSVSGAGGTTGLTLSGGPITASGTLTLGGTLVVANGGTGATDAAGARTNLGAAASGAMTSSGITMSTARILGRTTAATGAVEEISIGSGLSLSGGTLSSTAGGGTVTSVGMTVPAFLSVTPASITTSGTFAVSLSGTALPIANGGTGSTATAYCSLTTNVTGTLPIANGGTGATTAGAALTNLGAYAASNPSGYTSNVGTVTSVGGTGSANGLSLSGTVSTSGNLTLSGSVTSVATGATIDGVTIGFRNIPRSTTSGTAATTDVGRCIAVTAGITIPNATFAAGDAVSIYNDSAAGITITQGASLTLRQAGTTNTGNRTLAARGMATIWFNSASEAIISGAGVT